MILITIGSMCLLELKKEQQDKNRNSAEKFFLIKNVFYCVVLKEKNMFYLKETYVLKQAHIFMPVCVCVCVFFDVGVGCWLHCWPRTISVFHCERGTTRVVCDTFWNVC